MWSHPQYFSASIKFEINHTFDEDDLPFESQNTERTGSQHLCRVLPMEGLLSLSGVPPLELEVLPLLSAGLALEGGSGPK